MHWSLYPPVIADPDGYVSARRRVNASPVTALQIGNPTMGTVSREPQTTTNPSTANAPFIRLSRKSFNRGYSQAGFAFGSLVNNPIKPVGGWLRWLLLTIEATGGTSTAAAVAAADAPWSVIQTLLLRDPLGQPVISLDGFSSYVVNIYGGQCRAPGVSDPAKLPSYVPIQTALGAGCGDFTFKLQLPFELDSSGYCSLSSLNAAATLSLDLQLAGAAAVYSTAPTTLPTINVTVEQAFWAAPVQNASLGPPDPGASAQWTRTGGSSSIPSAANTLIASSRKGTFIHTLIGIVRDSTGARVDVFPASDLTLQLDGVPVIIESFADRQDEMFSFTAGAARPTGVIVYTYRDSVQQMISQADTHDLDLPTTPATLLEVGGTWGAIVNAPAQLYFVTGELFPTNNARVPWSHLAS